MATQLQAAVAIRTVKRYINGNGIQLPRLEFKRHVALGAMPLDTDCSGHVMSPRDRDG
ncbi:hypothetical protein C4K02_0875 [Pseudomonas synxantha]|nr:hypothetical protein C4K02_0875 [Pseudomonas synxantha]